RALTLSPPLDPAALGLAMNRPAEPDVDTDKVSRENHMRVRLIVLALLVVAVVAVAGCGSATRGRAAGSTAGTSAAENAGKPATDKPVTVPESLRFAGTTLDGKAFDGASMAGHPVVLWFWAPWCATCAGEAATVSDAAAKYKGSVVFLGVAGMGQ